MRRATPVLRLITGLDAFHVLAITIESNIGNALHMQFLEDSGESLAHTVLRHSINTFQEAFGIVRDIEDGPCFFLNPCRFERDLRNVTRRGF